LRSGST